MNFVLALLFACVESGSMLPDLDGRELSVAMSCRGKKSVILLQELVRRDDKGMPIWKTLDEAPAPEKATELLAPPCKIKGVEDPEIVAAGVYTKMGARVMSAFRANRARGKLEQLPAAAVTCEAIEAEE